MTDAMKLNELRQFLDSLDYPVTTAELRESCSDISLQYADGEEALTTVIDRINESAFQSADSLEAEIFSNLPVEAVGEPGQSEGEG